MNKKNLRHLRNLRDKKTPMKNHNPTKKILIFGNNILFVAIFSLILRLLNII